MTYLPISTAATEHEELKGKKMSLFKLLFDFLSASHQLYLYFFVYSRIFLLNLKVKILQQKFVVDSVFKVFTG
jgi:hypothetical protein